MASSRLYARLLLGFTTLGIIVLSFGDNALSLFKVLGVFAGPILDDRCLSDSAGQYSFLPKEIRPPMWRRIALIACGLCYGALGVAW